MEHGEATCQLSAPSVNISAKYLALPDHDSMNNPSIDNVTGSFLLAHANANVESVPYVYSPFAFPDFKSARVFFMHFHCI